MTMTFNKNVELQLDDMLREANRPKEDYIAPRQMVGVSSGGGLDGYKIHLGTFGNMSSFTSTRFAVEQLADRAAKGLRSHLDYVEEAGPVQKMAFCSYLSQTLRRQTTEPRVMIRTQDFGYEDNPMIARGVVGDMFKALDTDLMLETVAPIVLATGERWQCIGGNRTPNIDHIKFVSEAPLFNITDGQGHLRKFHAGFLLSNSEVGMGSLRFRAFLTDDFCTNGCIFNAFDVVNVKMMHRGSRITSDFGLLDQHIRKAEQDSMKTLLHEATVAAVSETGFEQVRNLVENSVTDIVPENVDPSDMVIEVIKDRGIRRILDKPIRNEFIRAGDFSRFGMQAAITKTAQQQDSYERRIELESAGGDLLELSKNRWDAIVKKAEKQ